MEKYMSIMDSIKVAFFDLGGTLVGANRDWIPGAKETLFKIRGRNIRLGLISNTAALSRPQILELLPEDFDITLFEKELIIFSSEVNIEKPDPQIFRLAIQRTHVEPGKCLFCTEEAPHILTAQQEGMLTALVKKPPDSDIGTLVERLTAEGLLNR
jgi:FMN phosphatase YigB (HAD superfamily)